MIKVGITGGIGSGKSTVCKIWEEMGAVVVYADDLAKELMVTDPELVSAIRSAFGGQAYREDGTLNRSWLAEAAFQRGEVGKLNALVHPAVIRSIRQKIREAEERGETMFVEEAALLLDRGRPDLFDFIVLVEADPQQRLQRVMERDGVSSDAVLSRMQKQKPPEELRKWSDFIIDNNGSRAELEQKAREVWHEMIRRKGKTERK